MTRGMGLTVAVAAAVIAVCQIPSALLTTSQLFCIYAPDDWDGAYQTANHHERVNWCFGSSPVKVDQP
ncbi:hypothetical protein [Synechococcus sp. UW140]|uniref:hypothetical protein n=1 Tax=Synechococcus sp. UW140 TaxID=368503 RepID=UPI0010BDC9CA|nr:hypothetical protein [Synechococcus sp. UW140]